jgi:wobble nucleotide-excising tRNase
METRVAKLESHFEYMRRDISELKSDVKAISSDLVTLKIQMTHVDKHMVTKAQLASYALLSLIPILGGGWWIVQQYLAPILKALPQ